MRCDAGPDLPPAALMITAHSPVDLMVTDPAGTRLGFDLAGREVVDQIFGGQYTGHGSEPQSVTIPNPLPGDYSIQANGRGSGTYSITVQTLDGAGSPMSQTAFTGNASPGVSDNFTATLNASGCRPAKVRPALGNRVCPPSFRAVAF